MNGWGRRSVRLEEMHLNLRFCDSALQRLKFWWCLASLARQPSRKTNWKSDPGFSKISQKIMRSDSTALCYTSVAPTWGHCIQFSFATIQKKRRDSGKSAERTAKMIGDWRLKYTVWWIANKPGLSSLTKRRLKEETWSPSSNAWRGLRGMRGRFILQSSRGQDKKLWVEAR